MIFWKLASAAIAIILSTSANAALVARDLDGNLNTIEAYYDNKDDITWLSDANYAVTSGYSALGGFNWTEANAWAASLDFNGITGWRLPTTLQPDSSCDNQHLAFSIPISYGYNCTGGELGNMFYNVLGGTAGNRVIDSTDPDVDLFSNLTNLFNVNASFWTSTEYEPNVEHAWHFSLDSGYQGNAFKTASSQSAWAVHNGDVGTSVVPVPAAVWLFGSGLIGLIGFAKRKIS